MRPTKDRRRSIPNAITATRFLFALALLFLQSGSVPFWLCYGGGAASDVLDGWLARRFQWESDTGAKWDSLADVAFLIALLMVGLRHRWFPVWALWWALGVAVLRGLAYAIGWQRFHTFAALHTWLNKLAGLTLVEFPVVSAVVGTQWACRLAALTATVSAVEELVLLRIMPQLNRDCRGFWQQK